MMRKRRWLFGLLPGIVLLAAALVLLLVIGLFGLPGLIPGAGGKDGVIAFASNRNGNFEIYVMAADGSGQTQLTRSGQLPPDSPVGQIRSQFAGALKMSLPLPSNNRFPVWSPDGDQLLYYSSKDNSLLLMDVGGRQPERLAYAAYGGGGASWSPDGTQVAYIGSGLYTIGADGRGRGLLTEADSNDYDPDWSPDGTRIVFRSTGRADGAVEAFNQIYVLDVATGQVVQLTDSKVHHLEPAWSPDGQKIAYVTYSDGNAEIYVMSADGSNQTRLTFHPAWDQSPAWSPDGRHIVFVSRRDVDYDIYRMAADGSGLVQLTDNDADDVDPHWRPR